MPQSLSRQNKKCVFISYSSENMQDVSIIYHGLQSHDVNVWVSYQDIPPGADWNQAIDQALELASHIIVVVSQASNTSTFVKGEWVNALKNGKTVIPLLIEDVELPVGLNAFQCVYFHKAEDKQKCIEKLAQRLLDNLSTTSVASSKMRQPKNTEQPVKTSLSKRTQVSLRLDLSKSELDVDKLLQLIAGLTDIGFDDIDLVGVTLGSVVVTIELPKDAATHLLDVAQKQPELLAEFKVINISEIQKEKISGYRLTDENPANTMSSPQKVIVLAGAGASAHLGLPALDDLLEQAVLGNDGIAELIRSTRHSIMAEPNRYRAAVFEELVSRIREYIKIGRVLRTDQTLRRTISGIPYNIDDGTCETTWRKALTRCYRLLLEEYGPNQINSDSAAFQATLDLFAELAEVNDGELHIFTTNYDCSYQVLGSNCRTLKFLSHIDNATGIFKKRWYPTIPELKEHDIPSVYIHRLHGCVAWFNAFASDDEMSYGGSVEEAYGAGGNDPEEYLVINDDDYLHSMCIKLIASQLIGTNPVFASAFDEFERYLKVSDVLFVWGYSFRDLEVMRLINNTLTMSASPLRIYFIDPYLPEATAIRNIRRTFQLAPIHASHRFTPEKIDWRPTQGYDYMIREIISKISS